MDKYANPVAMKQSIFEHLEMYFREVADDAVDVEYTGWFEIVVTVRDGQRYLFNDLDKGIRRLPDPDDMSEEQCLREFGWRLYNIMRCRGVGQVDLAEMTGIYQSRISNYVNGRMSPGFYNVCKIARALDVSIDEFKVS